MPYDRPSVRRTPPPRHRYMCGKRNRKSIMQVPSCPLSVAGVFGAPTTWDTLLNSCGDDTVMQPRVCGIDAFLSIPHAQILFMFQALYFFFATIFLRTLVSSAADLITCLVCASCCASDTLS